MESFEWFFVPSTFAKPILDEASTVLNTLKQLNSKSAELTERLSQSEANILKRLEWASSTNLSLREVQSQFEQGCRYNQSTVSTDNRAFGELTRLASGWMSFEQMRLKAIECENDFEAVLLLVDQCEVMETESSSSGVHQLSEVELNLIEFHKFKDKTQLNTGIIQVTHQKYQISRIIS